MPEQKPVEAWIADLNRVLDSAPVTVTDVRIGVFYTAAKLSNGYTGAAFTPRDLSDTVCCPEVGRVGTAGRSPGRTGCLAPGRLCPLTGAPAPAGGRGRAQCPVGDGHGRHGVPGGRLVSGMDALEAAAVGSEDQVAMVGGFVPLSRRSKAASRPVGSRQAPGGAQGGRTAFWRSPEQAAETLGQASVVLITGSSLVEGGIDGLLAAASNAQRIILAGPTASPWAPPFFEAGVHVLGGIRVLDGAKMLQVVAEGGSGYFFEDYAEKVSVVKEG